MVPRTPTTPTAIYCTDLDGRLLPFEKKFEDLVGLAIKNRWLSREGAESVVKQEMAQMPAWKDRAQQALRPNG